MDVDIIISGFHSFLKREKNASSNTIENYLRDSRIYLENIDKSLESINKTDIMSYIMKLQTEGKSEATVSRKLSSLRSLFEYLINHNLIEKNPTISIKAPRPQRKDPQTLTVEQVELLLDAPDENTIKGMRDRAILELMYSSGVKVGEVIELTIDRVNMDLDYIENVKRDGSSRYIPLGKYAKERLIEYLEYSRHVLLRGKSESALFLNTRGDKLSRQGVWKMIKSYADRLDMGKNISSNTLRHSLAVHMIENGAHIDTVKDILGHEDISTTQIYHLKSKQKLKEVYKRTHPRA